MQWSLCYESAIIILFYLIYMYIYIYIYINFGKFHPNCVSNCVIFLVEWNKIFVKDCNYFTKIFIARTTYLQITNYSF